MPPKRSKESERSLIELALGSAAKEFEANSKGLGKKLAKAAGTTTDIVNDLLVLTRSATSAIASGGKAFERKFTRLFSGRLAKIPAARRVRPLDAIAIPALQSLALRIDEPEIADMFANLLCAAMDKESAGKAHPAFVRVLSEMVSDEARILRHLKEVGAEPAIDVLSTDVGTGLVGASIEGLSLISIKIGAGNKGALPIHTSNLIRLGMIVTAIDEVFEESGYKELETSPPVRALVDHIRGKGRTPELRRRALRLTEFGRAFLRVCLPDQK